MKTKALLLSVAFVIVFITAQSFFFKTKPDRAVNVFPRFKGYTGKVAMCTTIYDLADSAKDITALTGWGHYKWKISGASDSVQYYFDQGISMYYAFHTIEAVASFIKATHLDPNCAMAWYGKALAMGPTINYGNDFRPEAPALEAAIKSKKLAAQCNPLEKQLIDAIQSRYRADTTIKVKQLRINYADAMAKVYESNKDNADVVTLYADALLLLHPWDLYDQQQVAKPWTPQIRSLLEHALVLSPKHPGANHYYIHTMEASAEPQLALKSAHLMDTLMPSVSHFTHMPSHIYIRTGDYERGIKVNDDAVDGYNKYLQLYPPELSGIGLYKAHNLHLKANCALMAGSFKKAIIAAFDVKIDIPPSFLSLPGADGNYFQYINALPLITYVRFGKWDEILKAPLQDSLVYGSVLQHFARGMAYAGKHDVASAKMELGMVKDKMLDKRLKVGQDNFSTAYEACVVGEMILTGAIALEQKQNTEAIDALQKAVAAEDHIIYDEPRDWPIPARHYLADALIKTGQYNKAIPVLNKDLSINPKNGWALTGLVLAYQSTGNKVELAGVQKRLKAAWPIKDTEIAGPVF